MTHWSKLQFFSDEIIQLQKEILHHPNLITLLERHHASEFEIKLAEIATYCEVILDGDYDEEAIIKLARILERKLYNMRPKDTGIILLN